mmetsp:Transcript_10350/g.18248  ORF Transcript_10350/g.18248 Transcript_10350/m.18248 type:complete len:493 (-) Transcript_10350:441-1919(-)
MQLSHSGNDCLARLLITLETEGRILLGKTHNSIGHLLLITLGQGFHSNGDHRLREVHLLKDDLVVIHAQGFTSGGVLKTNEGNNISSTSLLDLGTLIGVHLQDTTDTLLLTLHGVHHLGTGVNSTGVNTGERQRPNKGVSGNLEGKSGERLIIRGDTLHDLGVIIRVDTLDGLDVSRRGKVVNDSIQEGLDTLVLEGSPSHHRHELQLCGTLADALPDGGNVRYLIFQDHLHHVVVHLGAVLKELHAELFSPLLQLIRDGGLGHRVGLPSGTHLLTIPDQGLHLHQINHSFEDVLSTNGQLDNARDSAKVGLDHVNAAVEISTSAIHLVHETHTGHLVLISLAPNSLGLGLNTGHSIENADSTVKNTEGTLDLQSEVNVTRGINDVDLVLLRAAITGRPEASGSSRSNGDTTFLFLNHPIHRGATFVNLSNLVGLTSVVQDTLRGCRLTSINVGHDPDVAVKAQGSSTASSDSTSSRGHGDLGGTLGHNRDV